MRAHTLMLLIASGLWWTEANAIEIEEKQEAAESVALTRDPIVSNQATQEIFDLLPSDLDRRDDEGVVEPILDLGMETATEGHGSAADRRGRSDSDGEPADDPNTKRVDVRTLFRAGRWLEAKEGLREAQEQNPNSAPVHAMLAVVSQQLGDMDRAVWHNREALRLDPGLISAANNLAWVLATAQDEKVRRPKEAVRLASLATRATGDKNPHFLDTLGVSYAAAGRFEEAIHAASRAADLVAAKNPALAEEIHGRIATYRAEKPYVETSSWPGQ